MTNKILIALVLVLSACGQPDTKTKIVTKQACTDSPLNGFYFGQAPFSNDINILGDETCAYLLSDETEGCYIFGQYETVDDSVMLLQIENTCSYEIDLYYQFSIDENDFITLGN